MNKPWVAQALLPVPWLMHFLHRTQAGVPVPLKPEQATDGTIVPVFLVRSDALGPHPR